MAEISPAILNFNGGELSPLFMGRADSAKYAQGADTIKNFIVLPEGGVLRRPGSGFVREVKDSTKKSRNVPFVFSTIQAYNLEFGENFIRVFKDGGSVDAGPQSFVDGDVTVGTDEIDIGASHYFVDQQGPFQFTTTGVLPAGLSLATDYYISFTGMAVADTVQKFQVSLTAGGAVVDITAAAGGGTHTITAADDANGITTMVEVTSTYTEAEVQEIQYIQSADTLYIVHPDHIQAKLTRTAHDEWTLADIALQDGPYLSQNTTTTTFTSAATTGTTTLTSSSANTFLAGRDEGRSVRLGGGSGANVWGWGTINTVTSDTVVNWTIVAQVPAGAKDEWRMGAYYIANYPRTLAFFDQRLIFGGEPETPDTMRGSETGDFETFSPTAFDDANPADTNALSYTISADQVNVIRWIRGARSLILGTDAGMWPVQSTSELEALTPTDVSVRPSTAFGTAEVIPVKVGDNIVYVSPAAKLVKALSFELSSDSYSPSNLSLIASHIAGKAQFKFMEYAQEPYSIIWAMRDDGILMGCTFIPDQEVFAWHRHIFGGTFAGSHAVCESVAVIPATPFDHHQTWVIVKRTINGATKRYIEFLKPFWEEGDDLEDSFFVDSGLDLNSPINVTAATAASPVVITTSAAHGFSNDDEVRITHIVGMTELNTNSYVAKNVTATTLELNLLGGGNVDGSAFTAYETAGEIRKKVTAISGLDHLEGETVQILHDGSTHPDQVVTSGAITLDSTASEVQIGLGYMSDLKTTKIASQDQTASIVGKKEKVSSLWMRLWNTAQLKVGSTPDNFDQIPWRKASDSMNKPPPIFTGDRIVSVDSGWTDSTELRIRQDLPLPACILALYPDITVGDA